MKQVKINDIENKAVHSGILLDNGDVICGCCGGIQESGDKGITWDIVKVYNNWINLDDEILGDDWDDPDDETEITVCSCRHCSAYEDQNSRRGSCFRNGGFVSSDNYEDCIHCTGGLLIYGTVQGEDKQVTAIPIMQKSEKSPEEVVKMILDQPEQPDMNEGIKLLKKDINAFLEENELEDFQTVVLRFVEDR